MRSLVAVLLLALALLVAGVAFSLHSDAKPDGAAAPAMEMDGYPGMHDMGAGAYDWHGGDGQIPTALDAMLKLERRDSITIQNDSQFNPANGVRSGSGSFGDPYVISGWSVGTILIKDTHKAFEIKDDRITTILVLDWTGRGGYVHHNYIENLRTNRNVARTGDASATVIENNEIARVQELRHFDGEVRNNTIGDASPLASLTQNGVVLNIAGLDGAGIHDNTIYGGVDMKIHGHHHSDHEGGASHNHGVPENATAAAAHDDHQVRFVDFEFFRNHIIDNKFGLRYNDANHAGDDRTATSEQEPDLNLPHVHHTRISIHDNTIEGSAFTLDIVNAPDDHHLPGESAFVDIANNTIVKPATGSGMVLAFVRNATVHVHGNTIGKSTSGASTASAILMKSFMNATILVDHNALGADGYGIRASDFDARTHWILGQNDEGGVAHPVYWDSSVANAPETQDASDGTMDAGMPSHGGSQADADVASELPFDVRNSGLN